VVGQDTGPGLTENIHEVMVLLRDTVQIYGGRGSGHGPAHSFGSRDLEMKTLGTLHLACTNERIGIDEGNSRGFPGFRRVLRDLGSARPVRVFSVTGASNFGFGETGGFDCLLWGCAESDAALDPVNQWMYRVSQWYPSTRVQLESKG